MPAQATVSAVWRNRCPNRVRVEPGSTVAAVVTPILNPRVGRLLCQGGKPKCEPTNLDPGAMVELAPHVVESTYLHTETGSGCEPANYWSEFMMFSMGGESGRLRRPVPGVRQPHDRPPRDERATGPGRHPARDPREAPEHEGLRGDLDAGDQGGG